MRCEDCIVELEAYFDGELDNRVAAQVGAHLSACAACSAAYDELALEQRFFAGYRPEIEVTPAARHALFEKLKQERPVKRESLFKLLASIFHTPRFSLAFATPFILILIALTVLLTRMLLKNEAPLSGVTWKQNVVEHRPPVKAQPQEIPVTVEKPDSKPLMVASRKRPQRQPTPTQLLLEAERKYMAAIDILTRDANRNRSSLDAETIARFDKALMQIDQTIAETRRTVRKQPDDPEAAQYMLMAYAKKVEILKEIASAGE